MSATGPLPHLQLCTPVPRREASAARLESMWLTRTRLSVACLSCNEVLLAISVTETRRYQWSCVACGWRSRWFRFVEGEICVDGSPSVSIVPSRSC